MGLFLVVPHAYMPMFPNLSTSGANDGQDSSTVGEKKRTRTKSLYFSIKIQGDSVSLMSINILIKSENELLGLQKCFTTLSNNYPIHPGRLSNVVSRRALTTGLPPAFSLWRTQIGPKWGRRTNVHVLVISKCLSWNYHALLSSLPVEKKPCFLP